MSNEPPTLADYEDAGDIDIDLSDVPISKEDINQNLANIFNGGSDE